MPGIGLIARPGRKVGLDHLAFLRTALEGADPVKTAARYLGATEDRIDHAGVQQLLRWLRLEFVGAAALAGQPTLYRDIPFFAVARMAAIAEGRQRRLRAMPNGALTLEDFGRKVPEGFYSPPEVAELYEQYCREVLADAGVLMPRLLLDQISSPQRTRALRCIAVLERFLVVDPQSGHPLRAWFSDTFAEKIEPAGVGTLGQLTAFIERHGHGWHRKVPRVGPVRAARVTQWLATTGRHPGGSLTPLALKPRTKLTVLDRERLDAASGELAPLERLTLAHPLSGEDGVNRGVRNRLEANNDLQAIHEWLSARARNPHTFRAYRREAERLLLWAVLEKGRALSSLTAGDCAEYVDFLIALGRPAKPWRWQRVAAAWIGPKSEARLSPHWRPFEGALSVNSIETAATILKAACEWLRRQRYLDSNPWDGVKVSVADDPVLKSEPLPLEKRRRALSVADWALLQPALDALGADEAACRQRFIVRFLYMTGLRLHELATATFGMVQAEDGQAPAYALRFRGKGGRVRAVPLAAAGLAVMRQYMQARGLGADPTRAELKTLPLVARLRRDENGEGRADGVSESRIYDLLRATLSAAADALEQEGKNDPASRLRQASTHWMRHSFATRSLQHMPLKHVQLLMGHGDIAITGEYISVEDQALRAGVEKAFG